MSHLFLISIGPVKGFISQARKSQDLFAGSALLSVICGWGMYHAEVREGGKVITPYFDSQKAGELCRAGYTYKDHEDYPSFPNRFLALFLDQTPESLHTIGENIENAIRERFQAAADDALNLHSPEKDSLPISTAWNNQIKSHLEISWLFMDLGTEQYTPETYKKIESRMGGIKNLRTFEPYAYQTALGEMGRKCNLDGERNIVIYRATPRDWKRDRSQLVADKLFIKDPTALILEPPQTKKTKVWDLSPGEGLSAVSFTKRKFLQRPHAFPSTTEICLLHIIQEFPAEWEALTEQWRHHLKHSNDQLIYDENFNADYLVKYHALANTDAQKMIDASRGGRKDFLKKVSQAAPPLPLTKYYGLLQFDGDEMGAWLSGEKINLSNAASLKPFHETLTRCLVEFGAQMQTSIRPGLVQNGTEPGGFLGKVVYAGGEDFLGFVNLHKFLETLSLIHQQFHTIVRNPLIEADFDIPEDRLPTLSAGLVLAHYKWPLARVIQGARETEKIAKDRGRNQICIRVQKRSGKHFEVLLPWEWTSASSGIAEPLGQFLAPVIQLLTSGWMSSNYLRETMHTLQRMGYHTPPEILKAELYRTARRSWNHQGGNQEEALKDLQERLLSLSTFGQPVPEPGEVSPPPDFSNFHNLLDLLDFMHRKSS